MTVTIIIECMRVKAMNRFYGLLLATRDNAGMLFGGIRLLVVGSRRR